MGDIKSTFSILGKNWTTFLLFEIIYKNINYSIIYSLIDDIFINILNIVDQPYISLENIHLIVLNPIAFFLLLLILIIITFIIFFEVSAIFIYCEKGWQSQNISFYHLIKVASIKSKILFNFNNFIIFVCFVLIVPLAIVPLTNNLIGFITVPEYIMDFIRGNNILFSLFIILTIVLNIIFFIYLFAVPSVLFDNKDFKYSIKASLQTLKNHKIKTLAKLLESLITYLILTILIYIFCILIMILYSKVFYPVNEAVDVFRFTFKNWIRVILIIVKTVITAWIISYIITLCHQFKKESRLKNINENKSLISHAFNIIRIIFAIFVLMIFSETEVGGNLIYNNQLTTEVVAHRAGAQFAPENTFSALKNAININADSAEIDVQQLKDGTLIIMHDNNFKRTTGVNKFVWDVGYNEVKNYDAGSWFSYEYKNEPVPLLEDMLIGAKDKIGLMIEVKLSGHEKNLEKDIVEMINKYGMINQCSIASMNLNVLKKIKELDQRIETIYITPVLYSDKYNINYIDGYSVETTSISKEMVSKIKFQGKQVYGWTSNVESTIKKNIWLGVNGIVTDNPELVNYYLERVGENLLLNSIVEIFF